MAGRYLRRILCLVAGASMLGSCMFSGLEEDVRALDASATISGTVHADFESDKPVFVALFRRTEGRGLKLDGYALRYGPGDFNMVREGGAYILGAFEDINADLTLQTNEYVGWHGRPTPISVKPGEAYTDIDIALRSPEQARRELPGIYAPGAPSISIGQSEYPLGQVTKLTDPRLARQVGKTGLWEPVKFFQRGYAGIFFLEPFDPAKIPVLFVHGIGGSAIEWRFMMDRLDTDRFQPWLLQYPSGIRLGMVSDGLTQAVLELQVKHRFENLIVIAHSMGGLVARGFINRNEKQGQKGLVKLFATLSTPWLGHASAELGVDMAPVAVPSWHDMVPGSPYLQSLFSQTLPEATPYFLLFSHKGSFDIVSGGNSDGAVTLESQLASPAQKAAARIVGFDETHTGILISREVADELDALMVRRATELTTTSLSQAARAATTVPTVSPPSPAR